MMVSKFFFEVSVVGEFCEVLTGTPATVSQMAKDVTTFLRWASGEFVHR